MLGKDLAQLLTSKGFDLDTFCYPEYDITREADIKKIIHQSDVIVNCAAYTNVDGAESDIENCYAVNTEAVGKLGDHAAEIGKYLIHISTDFVFGDKSDGPLNEKSITNPLGIYGKSKLEGELLLAKSGCMHSTIRVEWTYGQHGNNFITKILSLATKLNELKVVDDQFGSPTSTTDIAQAILFFIKHKVQGLYHFSAEGYVNRYEAAKAIFDILDIDKKIVPCSSSTFPTPAKRPSNSRFDCSKIDKILDYKRPSWKDSLRKYLSEIESQNC